MPNSAQLKARGNEILAQITALESDETLSATEKGARYEAIYTEYEDHQKDVSNSERASEMRSALGSPEMAVKGGDGADLPQMTCEPLSHGMVERYSKAVLRHPEYRRIAKAIEGAGEEGSHVNRAFSISRKDATEINNEMGEAYYGNNAAAGLSGSSLFLPGAFGPALQPQFIPGFVEQRLYELTLANLWTNMPVDVPVVTYAIQETLNLTANAVAEGGSYPFGSTTFGRAQETVGKVALAMTVTDETIRDMQQMFTFLQGELVIGVQRQEEVQLLAGSGTYPAVNGLLARAASFTNGGSPAVTQSATFGNAPGAGLVPITIGSLPYGRNAEGTGSSGSPAAATTIAETVLEAMIDVQLSIFFTPNVILCNPRDYQTIRIGKDNQGQYYGGSFWGTTYGYAANQGNSYLGGSGNTLWNTRLVQTPTIPQGTILIGYFGPECSKVLRREGISLEMTNANGNDFVDGKITIRAEERCGLMVQRPLAFQLVAINPAP